MFCANLLLLCLTHCAYLLSISSLLEVLKQASKQREFPVYLLSGHFFPCFDQLAWMALFKGLQAEQ